MKRTENFQYLLTIEVGRSKFDSLSFVVLQQHTTGIWFSLMAILQDARLMACRALAENGKTASVSSVPYRANVMAIGILIKII